MNTEPLKNYFKSIEAFKAGNIEVARHHLAKSVGLSELTPFMREHLDKLVDVDNPAMVTLVLAEMEDK